MNNAYEFSNVQAGRRRIGRLAATFVYMGRALLDRQASLIPPRLSAEGTPCTL